MPLFDRIKSIGKSIGGSVARAVLPRSLEERFGLREKEPAQIFPVGEGLTEKQTTQAKRALIGATPKVTQQSAKEIQSEFQADPTTLKNEIRQVILKGVQSGVLNKNDIKRDVKNYINQKVNERILSKVVTKPPRSVSGFIENAKEDVVEIVDGIGALLGLGFKAVTNPGQAVTTASSATLKLLTSPAYRQEVKQLYIDPIIEEYKEYRHPTTKLYEDPVDVFLDVTALFSLGATAAGKVGLTSVSKGLRQASQVASLRNISKTTKWVVRQMPGGDDIVRNLEISAQTRKLLQKEQTQFLIARNNVLNEVDKRINKLTKKEVRALPLAAEGFARPPTNASKEFYEALGLMRSLAKDQQRFGLKTGALTPEIIERRRFQPLAKFLEKEGNIHSDVPYEKLTGNALNGYIKQIQKFFPEADPIYMRHFFEDNPKKFSSFFLNTKPVRSFKPGFLKKSYGKDGYIGQGGKITKEQLKEVLERQATENVKWQRNMQLIERLKKHPLTKELKKGQQPLPGHKVFAPDGFIRFYKGTIDLADEVKKKIGTKDDVWEAFEDAVESAFPKQRDYIGVTKAKLYQVPEAMANQLTKLVASSNPIIKLFWDKPLDAFRFSVLSLFPRWHFNNIVGNAIFSIVSGDVFNPKAFYHYVQARRAGVLPDDLFGGVHRVEKTTSGKLGSAAEVPWVKSTAALHDKLLDTRVVGAIVRNIERFVKAPFKPLVKLGNLSFRANQAVDDLFKGVAFINRALKEDRKGFLTRMTASFDDTLKAVEKTKIDEKLAEKLIDDVHNWYYHGLNLTDFERRAVRRVIPFYSWMRWATLYSYRITTEAPVRANIIKNLARDFYTFTGQNKLPEWMGGAVPVGTDEDGTVYYLKTRGMNPFSHINDFISEGVFGTALQGAAPGIKTLVEQSTGEEVFLGRPFTKEDVHETFGGRLYRFDPELGEVKEVTGKVKPKLVENLLRNYIPQYLLMEVILTGGRKRYTAEGLDTILSDLFKDEAERKAIVKDIITKQGEEKTTPLKEAAKAFGINIQDVTPEDERSRQKALEQATSAIKNKELPILNPQFKNLVKERIFEEIAKGTPRSAIAEKVKAWIGANANQLKELAQPSQ